MNNQLDFKTCIFHEKINNTKLEFDAHINTPPSPLYLETNARDTPIPM